EVGRPLRHLAADVGRGHPLALAAHPARHEDCGGDSGSEAEGHPERSPHSLRPRIRLIAAWAPAVKAANLISGLLTVRSTTSVSRRRAVLARGTPVVGRRRIIPVARLGVPTRPARGRPAAPRPGRRARSSACPGSGPGGTPARHGAPGSRAGTGSPFRGRGAWP